MRLVLLIATYVLFLLRHFLLVTPNQVFQEAQSNLEHLEHNPRMPDQRHQLMPQKNLTIITKQRLSQENMLHTKGGWMFTYRTMDMHMEDNLDGSKGISSDEIVTSVPNRFYGVPGQPSTLRVVPTEMDSRMDMFSLMYAQTDKISWMLMLHHIEKSMKLYYLYGWIRHHSARDV